MRVAVPVDEAGADSERWPEPRRLGSHRLPDFPLDALTPEVALYAEAVSAATQTPPDLVAGMILATISVAVLGAARVEVRPGWIEEPALYVAAVLASGERKSAVLDDVARPLHAVQRERVDVAQSVVREARAELNTLEAQRKTLIRAGEADPKEIAVIDERREELAKVRPPRFLADDATPEALARLLLADNHAIGVLSAEGTLLANVTGRYSDGEARVELICKAYSAEPATVDRRGSDPLILDAPRMAIGLCIQPPVLEAFRANRAARGQGLVPRFAFLMPSSLVGERDTAPPQVPPTLAAAWKLVVRRLADLPRPEGFVGFVGMSPGAGMFFDAYRAKHEPRLKPGSGDLAAIADWANRHPGRVALIALILHLLAGGSTTGDIDEDTIRNATRIGEHLTAHALVALDADGSAALLPVVRWIVAKHHETVTVRELHHGPCGHGKGTADAAHAVAGQLVDAGYLRKAPPGPRQVGRPTDRYDVHPRLSRPTATTFTRASRR